MIHVITGGAGFIGTNYIRYILKKYPSDRIICADKLTYAGNRDNLKELEKDERFIFEQVDICDRKAVCNLFRTYRPDCVVNFAAESHVDRSIENPEIFLKTNVMGTGVLLDAVNEMGVTRFHQISTDEVYGDLAIEDTDVKFSEKSILAPSSPYSASKASADLLCLCCFRTYNTPVTISRSSNNYGPYQFPEKLIPVVIEKALRNEAVPVYGDGKNVRDWIHVNDHCSAIDAIIRGGKAGEIYNVGGGNERSNTDVVKAVLKALGKPEELIQFVKDRPGHDRRYSLNCGKIKTELGWTPQTDFEQGLCETIEWYKSHKKWLEKILKRQ